MFFLDTLSLSLSTTYSYSLSHCYKSQVPESKNHKTYSTKNPYNFFLVIPMELLTLVIVSFLLAFSFLLAPCASDQIDLKKPLQQAEHGNFPESSSLPRKLNLNHETLKISDEEKLTRRHELRQASSGTKQHEKEENVINAAEKETKDEVKEEVEEEESKKSEYFTMDYRWVKKRRPIHNKQIPFIP